MNPAAWGDERLEALRALAGSGLSGSAIARELGVTRNAVLGKCHRHGIKVGGGKPEPRIKVQRAAGVSKPVIRPLVQPAPRPRGPVARVVAARPTPAAAKSIRALESGVPLLELRAGQCRYPLGGSRAPARFFRGEPIADGRSYCAEHHSACYRPRVISPERAALLRRRAEAARRAIEALEAA